MTFSKYNLIIPVNNQKSIVFNTLNGNVLEISNDVAQIIEDASIEKLQSDNYDEFNKYGIVISEDFDEQKFYSYAMNKSKFSSQVVSATILLTHACNFRCTYCYEGAGEVFSNSMTKKTADFIINYLTNVANMHNSQAVDLTLFGGEPLLNIERGYYILDKLSKYCENKKKTLSHSVITNGFLLTEEIIKNLENYNCQFIQITLDGPQKIHDTRRPTKDGQGTFQKILDNIKLADGVCKKAQIVVRINIDKANIENIEELFSTLQDLKLRKTTVDFGIVRGTTKACKTYSKHCLEEHEILEKLPKLWELSKKYGFHTEENIFQKWIYCGMYKDLYYTFAPSGDLYKCWELVGQENHKIGEFKDDGSVNFLNPLWDWMSHNPLENKSCQACSYLPTCGGGCGGISYANHQTYHEKVCFKIKGIIEHLILNKYNVVYQTNDCTSI